MLKALRPKMSAKRTRSVDGEKLSGGCVAVRFSADGMDQVQRLAQFFQTSPSDVVRNLLVRAWEENKEKVIALERARESLEARPLAKAGSGGQSGGGR